MNLNYLKEGLDHLGRTHFQKTWPEESIKIAAQEVLDIEDKALVKTISRVMIELSPSTFPALKRIIDILREEQVKINLSKSPDEPKKRYENDMNPAIDRRKIGQMGFDSLRLIDALFDNKLSRENFIEGMEVFDKTYPCCGWKHEASVLAGYYSRGELDNESISSDELL